MMRFLFVFLFLLPSALAVECSQLPVEQTLCQQMQDTYPEGVASLVYTSHGQADHSFARDWNRDITVNQPPERISTRSATYIRSLWVAILTVEPSVQVDGKLYVENTVTARLKKDHQVRIPPPYENNRPREGEVCRREYRLTRHTSETYFTLNGHATYTGEFATYGLSQPALLEAHHRASVTVEEDISEWFYLGDRNWACEFVATHVHTENVHAEDTLQLYPKEPVNPSIFTITKVYRNTLQGTLNVSAATTHVLIGNASVTKQHWWYFATFSNEPYPLLQLHAERRNLTFLRGVNEENGTLIAPFSEDCTTRTEDFFNIQEYNCQQNLTAAQPLVDKQDLSDSWYLLVLLATVLSILYSSFIIIKKTWGKYFLPILLLLVTLPSVRADECGLTNLGACLPESLFSFFENLVNEPIQPLLQAIQTLMTSQANIEIFFPLWLIIIYTLSFFYLLLLAFVAFSFVTAGHDIIKRERAKQWLKNTLLVIIFTSMSFYVYELVLELSAVLTSSFLTQLTDDFFQLSLNNVANAGLSFLLFFTYTIILLVTILLLVIRFIFASIGVIFAPIALFCYFIPPLKSYGNLILQLQGFAIFLPALASIIFVACAQVLTISLFSWFSIVVMMCCFLLIDVIIAIGLWHIIIKSGIPELGAKVAAAGKYVAALV